MSRHQGHFHFDRTGEYPVVRWNSNNNIPPVECLVEMYNDKEISAFVLRESIGVDIIETQQKIEEYRERMKDYVPSPEEMCEMRAAFGSGTTVVDVITGKETRL